MTSSEIGEEYLPYATICDEVAGFNSGDVIFRNVVAPDNRLYRQMTDADNIITEFAAVDIGNAVVVIRFEDFLVVRGATVATKVTVGEPCLFCFATFGEPTVAFLFSDMIEIDFTDCLSFLVSRDLEDEIGIVIEFLLRAFSREKTAEFVRATALASSTKYFAKCAAYIFISSSDAMDIRQVVDFFRSGEINVDTEGNVEIQLCLSDSRVSTKTMRAELDLLFPNCEVQVDFISVTNQGPEVGETPRDQVKPESNTASSSRYRKRRTDIKYPNIYDEGMTGADLFSMRAKLGYSRPEFAELLDVSADRIRRWESRKRTKNIRFSSQKLDQLQKLATETQTRDTKWLLKGGKARNRNTKSILRTFNQNAELIIIFELSRSANGTTFVSINPYSGILGDRKDQQVLASLADAKFVYLDDENRVTYIKPLTEVMRSERYSNHRYLVAVADNRDALQVFMISRDVKSHNKLWESWYHAVFKNALSPEEIGKLRELTLGELSSLALDFFGSEPRDIQPKIMGRWLL